MTTNIMCGSSNYFELSEDIEKKEAALAWAKFIYRHREQLEPITDIVYLAPLWDRPRPFHKGQLMRLQLEYKGQACKGPDARADLIRIMEALDCADLRLRICGGGDTRPYGIYEGKGYLGKTKLAIQMEVSWLPSGCEITQESHRGMRRTVSYSHFCYRR